MKNELNLQLTDAFGRLHNSSPDGGCHGSTIRYWHGGEEMYQFFCCFFSSTILKKSSFFNGRAFWTSSFQTSFSFFPSAKGFRAFEEVAFFCMVSIPILYGLYAHSTNLGTNEINGIGGKGVGNKYDAFFWCISTLDENCI